MDKCPYLVVKLPEMADKELNKKKTKKATSYNEEHKEHIVSEPEAVYVSMYNPAAMRTISLMGMDNKKDFSEVKSESDFINVIRAGIPKQAMTHLMHVADLSLIEMAAITHTSDRTLRRYKPQQKLSQEQSERMIEMAGLYSRGAEVFGDMNSFKNWMDSVLLSLGNKKPKEFLDTSIGIKMLTDELGRIEHGILA